MSVHFQWPDDDDEIHSHCLLRDVCTVGVHTTVIPVGEASQYALKVELHGSGWMKARFRLVE